MAKRLFIFGGYDKDGIVDGTLLYYLQALSELGDIVFNMDNDASDFELSKIKSIPNMLYVNAKRYGEYDFGSYKRGYAWAKENDIGYTTLFYRYKNGKELFKETHYHKKLLKK